MCAHWKNEKENENDLCARQSAVEKKRYLRKSAHFPKRLPCECMRWILCNSMKCGPSKQMGYAESATLHRTWAYTVAHVTFTWWNSHEMVRMRNMFWLWDTHTHFVGHFVLFSASPSHLPCRHFDPRSKTKKRRGDACPYDFALKFICCNRRSWYVLINLLFPFPHKRRSSSLWFWISIWKAVRMCATQKYIYVYMGTHSLNIHLWYL